MRAIFTYREFHSFTCTHALPIFCTAYTYLPYSAPIISEYSHLETHAHTGIRKSTISRGMLESNQFPLLFVYRTIGDHPQESDYTGNYIMFLQLLAN